MVRPDRLGADTIRALRSDAEAEHADGEHKPDHPENKQRFHHQTVMIGGKAAEL